MNISPILTKADATFTWLAIGYVLNGLYKDNNPEDNDVIESLEELRNKMNDFIEVCCATETIDNERVPTSSSVSP